jgi:hypothetical protein
MRKRHLPTTILVQTLLNSHTRFSPCPRFSTHNLLLVFNVCIQIANKLGNLKKNATVDRIFGIKVYKFQPWSLNMIIFIRYLRVYANHIMIGSKSKLSTEKSGPEGSGFKRKTNGENSLCRRCTIYASIFFRPLMHWNYMTTDTCSLWRFLYSYLSLMEIKDYNELSCTKIKFIPQLLTESLLCRQT